MMHIFKYISSMYTKLQIWKSQVQTESTADYRGRLQFVRLRRRKCRPVEIKHQTLATSQNLQCHNVRLWFTLSWFVNLINCIYNHSFNFLPEKMGEPLSQHKDKIIEQEIAENGRWKRYFHEKPGNAGVLFWNCSSVFITSLQFPLQLQARLRQSRLQSTRNVQVITSFCSWFWLKDLVRLQIHFQTRRLQSQKRTSLACIQVRIDICTMSYI